MALLTKAGQRALPPLTRPIHALWAVVLAWQTRRLTRTGLQRLDDHLLDDIGLSDRARRSECAKPFWQA
jgi:uncharacterized protein YjiS (DUF1127 family)